MNRLFTVSVLLILLGCVHKPTASKNLFRTVIDAALRAHPVQVCDTPRNIISLPGNYSGKNVHTGKDLPAQFATATRLGYVTVTAGAGHIQDGFQVYRVEQTPKMQVLLTGKKDQVCAGILTVRPDGQVNATVQYTAVPDWAKNRTLLTELGLFSLASAELASAKPQSRQIRLVLKDSGWEATSEGLRHPATEPGTPLAGGIPGIPPQPLLPSGLAVFQLPYARLGQRDDLECNVNVGQLACYSR